MLVKPSADILALQVALLKRSTPVRFLSKSTNSSLVSYIPFKTNHFGQVPPMFVKVFSSCGQLRLIIKEPDSKSYSHIRATNQRVRYPSVKGGNAHKLNSPRETASSLDQVHIKELEITYEANPEATVYATKKAKKPVESGGLGNQNIMRAAITAKPKRGQNAKTQGRRGLPPIDHRAASHPPII